MATTVSYSASMRTRKTNSASNAKSSAASQEYYENTYNYVGIVHFAGMALSGKVITGISLRIVAALAGYGTGHTKTVYVRKANYQSASQSGITGLGYCGDALGTFTGAFYGNTSTYTLSGDLLNNLAAYIAAGNNTICLYNPSSRKRADYLQKACDILLTSGKNPETVCGWVRNIGREGQTARLLTLAELENTAVDMFTTVFIGNDATRNLGGKMVTPRGYHGV